MLQGSHLTDLLDSSSWKTKVIVSTVEQLRGAFSHHTLTMIAISGQWRERGIHLPVWEYCHQTGCVAESCNLP